MATSGVKGRAGPLTQAWGEKVWTGVLKHISELVGSLRVSGGLARGSFDLGCEKGKGTRDALRRRGKMPGCERDGNQRGPHVIEKKSAPCKGEKKRKNSGGGSLQVGLLGDCMLGSRLSIMTCFKKEKDLEGAKGREGDQGGKARAGGDDSGGERGG